MIKGTYIFYQDGKEICRHQNIITKFGKRFLTNFLAGNVSFNAKELALGIKSVSDRFATQVIGGDISSSEKLVVSISALGQVSEPILRSGAKTGDKFLSLDYQVGQH